MKRLLAIAILVAAASLFIATGAVFAAMNFSASNSANSTNTTTPTTAGGAPLVGYATPKLNIRIPGIDFAIPSLVKGHASSNFIGTYVSGVYRYLLGFAMTIAIVMIMVGGTQYVLGASSGDITKGKNRIWNAIEGFVLLMFVYVILYTTNPELVLFREIRLIQIEEILLDYGTSGPEGEPSTCSGATSIAEMPDPYKTIIANVKSSGKCEMTGGMLLASPTGKPPNCGKHHWYDGGTTGDWNKMKNLDYAAPWAKPILAPFDGIATYKTSTDTKNRCGNTIQLKGSGASISICHAKDFIGSDNLFKEVRDVKQGEVMGHLGGNCCKGEKPPAGWSANKNGWCNKTGPACTDPKKNQNCSCQAIEQAGNTSGPHVHITWNSGGNMLACLKEE